MRQAAAANNMNRATTTLSLRSTLTTFAKTRRVYESALLTFKGVDGYDVYNCSVPFMYRDKRHIYGRVERRDEWANSFVRLFVETGKDEFTLVPDYTWILEDPFIAQINGEAIVGGTHVRKTNGQVCDYYCDFFRGTPSDNIYFTTGPDNMKDIRLVQLADKRIGVFSRPRTSTSASIGFVVIDTIDELTPANICRAVPIVQFRENEWGGVNQPYLLTSNKIGCIAHYSYLDKDETGAQEKLVYTNCSFVFDPLTRNVEDGKIIGTKGCYPACPAKKPNLTNCAFTSGIVMRDDGKCDLYSGVGDAYEGRITIDYPFEGHGDIIDCLHFDRGRMRTSKL